MTDRIKQIGTYVEPPILHVLRQFEKAYPESVFPTPSLSERAKDAAAADVMRNLALPTMKRAADHIQYLERVMSMIAHCDTEGHEHYEPTGLYRSHMIRMARNALGDTAANTDVPPRASYAETPD